MGKSWRLRDEINKCYRQRGKHQPSPMEEDKELRRTWERHLAETSAELIDTHLQEVDADVAE